MTGHLLFTQARKSLKQLVPNLSRINYAAVIKEAGIQGFTDCLYTDPTVPPIKEHPSAIFKELKPLPARQVPSHWRTAFKAWRQIQSTASILRTVFGRSQELRGKRTESTINALDSEAAAILLSAEGAQTELGHFLFDIAVSSELGAFVAGHAPDLRRHQIHAILDTLSISPELLFWLGHNRPAFRDPCYTLAARGISLFAGLAATQKGDIKALRNLMEAAESSPSASTAAVALFPRCTKVQIDRWVANLRIAPRLQYEAVQWAKYTWFGGRWLSLRDTIGMPTDNGRWWYHSCRDIRPDPSSWDLDQVDALWCAELCIDLELPRLPGLIRERLWRNLSSDERDLEAIALLRWSQSRQWPS